MDIYFESVCEMDIIYNFEKIQFIIDELIIGGEMLETDKTRVPDCVTFLDNLQEDNPQGNPLKAIIDDLRM